MFLVDRLPDALWPSEKNVGGAHRTVRYVGGSVLLAVGVAALAGLLPIAGVLGVAALLAGVISLLEAHTQQCPGYAALGIDTCQIAEPEGASTASEPPAGKEAA